MGNLRAEEVLIPLRFQFLTCHFVALLAVIFGVEYSASHITEVNPLSPTTAPSDLDEYDSTKSKISAWTYVALACCGVEYITLFLGVSAFLRSVQLLDTLAHVCGVILVTLWYYNSWSVDALIAYAVVFNIIPVALEVLVLGFISRFSFARY